MLSKPHRKFCEAIVSGLTGVRAYALAYPSCSVNTARFNASHLRAKPHIQHEIARLRAQADAIVGPTVLTLIEKRLWLARVVRANLAYLDPETDGDLLVSLHIEEGRKQPRVSRMRIANKLAAIRLDSRLAGDEPAISKSKSSTPNADSLAVGSLIAPSGIVVPFEHCGWKVVAPTAPQTSPSNGETPPTFKIHNSKSNISSLPTSPDTPAPEDPQASKASQPESSNASADSQGSVESKASADSPPDVGRYRQFGTGPLGDRSCELSPAPPTPIPPLATPTFDPSAAPPTFDPRPSSFDLSPSSPATSNEPPIDNGYIAPVFYERPRFDPGPEVAARMRAKLRQPPVERHLW